MLPFWRLDPPFRFAIYVAFAVPFASGAAWLVADQLKDTSNEDIWQAGRRLFPRAAWRHRDADLDACSAPSSRSMLVLAFNAVLIAIGSEAIRPWASGVHIAFGLSLPLLFLAHVKTGRRRA